MIKQDELTFRRLIKESTLQVLKSAEGQEAIKDGTLSALKSTEGADVIMDYLVDYFHEIVEPSLEDISHDIKTLKTEVKYMKDNNTMRIERLERKARLVS